MFLMLLVLSLHTLSGAPTIMGALQLASKAKLTLVHGCKAFRMEAGVAIPLCKRFTLAELPACYLVELKKTRITGCYV